MYRNTVVAAALMVLGCSLAGCGDSHPTPQPVLGRVTFQGKPVAAGMIRFSNSQATIDIMADLHPDGAYEVMMARGAGLPERTYQVAVMPPRVERPVGMDQPSTKPPACLDIPAKYRQMSTSELTLTVKPGNNVLDVDMQP
jgi:hypothetical protein